MKTYKTILIKSETEQVINRSRFIGRAFPVKDEGEALAVLAQIKKQHYDATHNCWAYRLGEQGLQARFSDDGEPQGTAGFPILDVLNKRNVTDLLVVVTRYFGGVLLGAGGLVRAYSGAASEAVIAAGEVFVIPALIYELRCDYSLYGLVQPFVAERAVVDSTEFAADVRIRFMIEAENAKTFEADLIEKTDGRVRAAMVGNGEMRKPI